MSAQLAGSVDVIGDTPLVAPLVECERGVVVRGEESLT